MPLIEWLFEPESQAGVDDIGARSESSVRDVCVEIEMLSMVHHQLK
jgi:hypothetical protein